jgi:hypothetical protein
MRRRDLVTLLGGAIAALPLAARAQQADRVRRIGMLLTAAADDPESLTRVGAFLQALAQLGWTVGRNVRIDTRWTAANPAEIRRHAAELAALAPNVILAHGTSTVGPLLLPLLLTEQIAHLRPLPIVFAWEIAREAKTPQTRHAASASPGTMLSSAQINGHIGHVG